MLILSTPLPAEGDVYGGCRTTVGEASKAAIPIYGWVSAGKVPNWELRLKAYNLRAKAPAVTNCQGHCSIIVRSPMPGGGEELSVCKVEGSGGKPGPPSDCRAFARWKGGKTRVYALRAVGAWTAEASAAAMAAPDYSVSVWNTGTRKPADAAEEIYPSLTPLNGKIRVTGSAIVVTLPMGTKSSLIEARQWGSIRFTFAGTSRRRSGSSAFQDGIGVEVWIAVLRNKRATADVADWQPLNEAEQAKYNDAVYKLLKPAITRSCTGKWQDDLNFECN